MPSLDRLPRVLFARSGVALLVAVAACGGASTASSSSASSSSTSSSGGASTTATEPSSASGASDATTAPAADGAAATASASSAAATPPPALHVTSEPGATGFFRNIDLDLHADGTLLLRGQTIGHMGSDAQPVSLDGQRIPLEGRITIGPHGRWNHLEVQADNTMTMDGGARVSIEPDGRVMLTRGHGEPQPAHLRVTGYHPGADHIAIVLIEYGMMRADEASR